MDGLALTILAALGTALVLGAVAHRLGQSPMIGYIAAGLLVGPFTPGYVADRGQVQALADIGVALLMFSIGLRFRLAELAEVGRAVLIGAPIQVAISLGLGTLAALLVGRTPIQAVFLGAVVSVCSSVVLVRVAGERTLETTLHGRLALGWSIVQDLLTVVLVVALAVMAEGGTRPILGAALATAVAVGFVVAVVVLGSRILPAAMSRIALLGSRELFVVAVAVIALGTATLAQAVGVSVALGAFLAGLALADSDLAASVLGEVVPLRELFATIFFVSVGILLEPAAIVAGWPIVLLLLVLIVAGKALPMAALLRLAGHQPGTALRAAGLVAQGGEFSFVLAAVGLQLGALDSASFSEAMGAVVLSIVVAGPVAQVAARLGAALERRAPPSHLGEAELPPGLRRHVVLLGYGSVGRSVARVLEARSIPWVAVDAAYPLVRAAAAAGAPVIYGDAGTGSVLEAVHVDAATALVVAVSDPLAARQAVQYAMRRNRRLHVIVRAHSEAEGVELQRMGAARVITAERQLGGELLRHALARYGVSEREIDVILRRRG